MSSLASVKSNPFTYAFRGIIFGFNQRNFHFHFFFAFLALFLSLILQVSLIEWTIIILLIFLVFAAEIFNTAIEEICNLVRDRFQLDYQATALPRDLAAGAVLIMAITSVVIGFLIFTPKILPLL